MLEKMMKREPQRSSSRSRSRSLRKSLSKSPVKIRDSGSMNGRRSPERRRLSPSRYSRERSYRSRSRSISLRKTSNRRQRTPYSRSRSRSYTPQSRRHSSSRSPYCDRKRSSGTRERPIQCRCLGIFGLNITTSEKYIREIFSKFGPIERVQLVIDAKTGRSRGFCFVYYDSTTDARTAKEGCNGIELDGRRIRVDYSITQRPHTPTPGVYMGRPTRSSHKSSRDDRYRDDYRRRRSPSPYRERKRRYDRSRSRSYTPRRYRY